MIEGAYISGVIQGVSSLVYSVTLHLSSLHYVVLGGILQIRYHLQKDIRKGAADRNANSAITAVHVVLCSVPETLG